MMDKEIKALWSTLLAKKKPSKETVKNFEQLILKDLSLNEPFIEEAHGALLIKFQGSVIAGLLPKTDYKVLTPYGNFEKYFSTKFWEQLAEKLVLSYESEEETDTKTPPSKTKEILKKFSKVHNEEKSNRSSGDYSELKVIQALCEKRRLPFLYQEDLNGVILKIKSMETGEEKLKKEDKNLIALIQGCEEVISKENIDPTEILWTGREQSGTEDIVLVTQDRRVLISLKSIAKQGSGTLKNLGVCSWDFLGLDIQSKYEKMVEDVLNQVSENNPTQSVKKISDVHALAKQIEEVKVLAGQIAEGYIDQINSLIFNQLQTINPSQFRKFIKEQVLDEKKESMWIVVANEQGLSFWNQKEDSVLDTDSLSVSEVSSKGFKILKNQDKFIRVNICCTNGKGLSPLAWRLFYA